MSKGGGATGGSDGGGGEGGGDGSGGDGGGEGGGGDGARTSLNAFPAASLAVTSYCERWRGAAHRTRGRARIAHRK